MLSDSLQCFLSMVLVEISSLQHEPVQPLTHKCYFFYSKVTQEQFLPHNYTRGLNFKRASGETGALKFNFTCRECVYTEALTLHHLELCLHAQQGSLALGHLTARPEGNPCMYMDSLVCTRPYKQLLFSFVASCLPISSS